MADKLYALTESDVDVLKQLVAAWRRGDIGRPLQSSRRILSERTSVLFGVAEAAIAGTTEALGDPGSGTLNVYRLTSTGGTTDSGIDETVYNLSTVERTTGEYTVCVRDNESGRWLATGGGGEGYKPLCRFTLDGAIGEATSSVQALLTDQYGPGTAHSTGEITVHNTLDGYTAGYMFEGSSGSAGLAMHHTGTDWIIIQLYRLCS